MEWIWVEKARKHGYERMLVCSKNERVEGRTKIIIQGIIVFIKYVLL